MRKIDKLTADASQQYNIVSEDGTEISLLLYYAPSQQTWFFDLTSGEFILNGCQLVNAPNILRSYKNLLSFGITIFVQDGLDPFYLDDFTSDRVQLFLLSRDDVDEIESRIYS